MKSILIKWVTESNKERPLKGKTGCSPLKQLSLISSLGAPKEVLRKCQFLIKTRGHDDNFFQRTHTIGGMQRGGCGGHLLWLLSPRAASPLPADNKSC